MVVDTEVPRNRANAIAAIAQRRSPGRDRLVHGALDRLEKARLELNLGNGAKPLRSRPPDPASSSRCEPPDRTTTRERSSPPPREKATDGQQASDGTGVPTSQVHATAGVVPFVVELRVANSRSPLRSHLCYATSATTPSGGASASRAPTRCCRSR